MKQGRFGRALEEYHAAPFFRPRDAFIVDRIKLAVSLQVNPDSLSLLLGEVAKLNVLRINGKSTSRALNLHLH